MAKENFFLAHYQAILDQNVTKVAKFNLFNDEEEDYYPNEYPEINYDKIFKDSDPADVLEELLKSKKYEDFYSLLIAEKKAVTENYYIACYQAVLEQNITSLMKLDDLSSQEKLNYPHEFPTLNYDEIFQNNDPDKIIDTLLESKEYEALVISYIALLKNNFYLSYYQSILDRNITKALELHHLTNEEKESYFEEYPNLNYNEIFKDNDPGDFLISLLTSEEFIDFDISIHDALNSLATENAIAKREKNHFELMEHPLLNVCPIFINKLSAAEILVSVSYSVIITKEEITSRLIKAIKQSPIISDVLSVIATSTTINSNKPFSIALIGDKLSEYDPTSTNIAGYFYNLQNKLVVTNRNAEFNLENIIHELTHRVMYNLFDNDSNPYNLSTENKYHDAIKNTLLNIKAFIQQDFDLEIKLENQNDTWQVRKAISSMLFPQYLNRQEDIEKFILLVKQSNLSIFEKFSWLDGRSFIEIAKWPSLSPEFKLSESLLSAKENVDFPSNFEEVYSINSNYQNITEKDTATREDQLFALEKLLMFYIQDCYKKGEEDTEFIARLPQIIAAGLYKGKIAEILQPIAEYWQEEIAPVMQEYLDKHDVSSYVYGVVTTSAVMECEYAVL
jgi:hypothetical protein